MPWREELEPVRMQRVAVVAPTEGLRAVLAEVADSGLVEVDAGGGVDADVLAAGAAGRLLRRLHHDTAAEARLSPTPADLDDLVREDRLDLVAGEAELEACAGGAVTRGELAAIAGWVPAGHRAELAERLAPLGGGVVALDTPRGTDPPTMLRPGGRVRRSFSPLVETYATVPYADVDPTLLAGPAYVLMFGMMFGDVGHGILLVGLGLLLRAGRPKRLAGFSKLWPFVVGAGLGAAAAGLLYGEFFGPTGVVPVLWLAPLEEPVTLLAAALGVGAVLIAAAYVVGTVNRWREGGWPLALIAPSGIAGVALFAGFGLVVLAAAGAGDGLYYVGGVVVAAGMTLAFIGFLAAAGGGAAGITQATVEVFDAVLRLGTNIVSFARLAAFGLTHAALGALVWSGTTALAEDGGFLVVAAVVLFVLGNAAAFTIEAVVAGIQAMRLEYYELFSRVFTGEGRAFRPWHVPVDREYRPQPTSNSRGS